MPTGSAAVVDVDIMDDSFLPLARAQVAQLLARDPHRSALWGPLKLTVTEERELEGQRFAASYPVRGRAEVWLEELPRVEGEGTLVHVYVQGEFVGSGRSSAFVRQQRRRIKSVLFQLRATPAQVES